MAWLLFTLMFGAATITVVLVLVLISVARSGNRTTVPSLQTLAAGIVFEVARGGSADDADLRRWMRTRSLLPAQARGIDLASWAEAYAVRSSEDDRARLLTLAVEAAMLGGPDLTRRQFHALQDLVFSLGYHADTIQHLRARHRFDYIDYAKERRPRNADRAGATNFYDREENVKSDLLLLGFRSMPDRHELISCYRRLVRENHPDVAHATGERSEADASARFIEITAAYERLLRRAQPRENSRNR